MKLKISICITNTNEIYGKKESRLTFGITAIIQIGIFCISVSHLETSKFDV